MSFLNKFFGKRLSTQEIVEKLFPMRIVNRRSWEEIRLWLDGVWAGLDQSEKNQQWLEVQEKFRFVCFTVFFTTAKKNGLSQEVATQYASKWTTLVNFWFADLDTPVESERLVHMTKLEITPAKEIELLIREIDRQDNRVTRYLLDWQADTVMAEGLKNLRWLQISGASVSAMNQAWDNLIFSLVEPSSSGQKYVGEFKDDQARGQGTLTLPDGAK